MNAEQKIELLKIANRFNVFSIEELIEKYNQLVGAIE